jgi:tetratricopeptide (TPR) repeat protein
MGQSNPKIEDLRFRIKTDPRSRLFFPLAEELRKVGEFEEAEQVLRNGLINHGTYLSAWVSLGRVLRDQKKNGDAAEALNKALQLDPGNVVAARLLADAYLELGEKVEAIKKYKLVDALLPGDEELEAVIARLEGELMPPPPPEPSSSVPESSSEFLGAAAPPPEELRGTPDEPGGTDELRGTAEPQVTAEPQGTEEPQGTPEEPLPPTESPFSTGDDEPMAAAHSESPFEEPAPSFTAAAVEIEQPAGMHVEDAPLTAEVPTPLPAQWSSEEEPADVFAPAEPSPDLASTVTMADLYASQGLVDDARNIYEDILARDPNNDDVRGKLDALSVRAAVPAYTEPEPEPDLVPEEPESPRRDPRVEKLEAWLARVSRRESPSV